MNSVSKTRTFNLLTFWILYEVNVLLSLKPLIHVIILNGIADENIIHNIV